MVRWPRPDDRNVGGPEFYWGWGSSMLLGGVIFVILLFVIAITL